MIHKMGNTEYVCVCVCLNKQTMCTPNTKTKYEIPALCSCVESKDRMTGERCRPRALGHHKSTSGQQPDDDSDDDDDNDDDGDDGDDDDEDLV